MGQQYTQLSAEERSTIMAMRARDASGREIARVLGAGQKHHHPRAATQWPWSQEQFPWPAAPAL